MGMAEEIQKLHDLKENGAISEDEYEQAKADLLHKGPSTGQKLGEIVDDISSDVNTWSMFIHLSQLCGYLVPIAGLIVPIVLWQIRKDESEVIDKHGRIVTNWIISEMIYAFICVLLFIVLIGIPMIIALAVMGIVFPILGGVKANNGEMWPYPLSIRFFAID